MRLTTNIVTLAGVLSLSASGHSQHQISLRQDFEEAKRSGLNAQVRATIRYTTIDQHESKTSSFDWEYYGGMEHIRTLPGSKTMMGKEAVWDGKRGMYRSPNSVTGPRAGHGTVRIMDHSPAWLSPIRDGYLAIVGTLDPHGVWVADMLQIESVVVETLPDGHVRLNAPCDSHGGRRIIEVDPQRGYMIDLNTMYDQGAGMEGGGANTLVARRWSKVLRAEKIGNCWIPTKIEARDATGSDSQARSVTELVDITPHLPKSAFAIPGRTGDTVMDGNQTYILGKMSDNPPKLMFAPPLGFPANLHDPSGSSASGSKGRLRFVAILAVGIGGLIAADLVWRLRSRRQRSNGYWGPPGQGPKR